MIADIVWSWPWALLALPLPLLVYWFAPARQVTQQRALRVPNLEPWVGLQHAAGNNRRGWFGAVLLALMWLALITALARPQSFGEPLGVPISGRDLMLCIDISGSMRDTDLYTGNTRASRLAVVKLVAGEFVAQRTGDRIGMIMFGSQAYVQTPLTLDHETVLHFLDEAAVGLAGRSTAIGDAIGLGVKRLRDRVGVSRVLILLTDGENSAGTVSPEDAANVAAENGIRIYTIGVGSAVQNGALRRNGVDEGSLQRIAMTTGGQYFRAHSAQELQTIYTEIDRLEPTDEDTEEFRPLREMFAWPLGIALLLSTLWAALRTGAAGAQHG